MKLVMLVSGFPRRSETFALNELLALDDAGCLAAIFATKPGETGVVQPGAERLLDKVHVLAPGTAAEQADEVVARVGATAIDGVHGYFAHLPTEVAEHAARSLGVPYGFSVHALDARRAGSEGLGRRARAAACVIACNHDVAGDVRRAGGTVTLVPHGVDLERFPATPPPADDGRLRLLAVGRLVAKKGFDTLVEAIARLAAPVALRIVGTGPDHDALREQIAAAGLVDRIELCGPRDHGDLPAEYAAAHIVVVPSVQDAGGDRDGLPNVVLEAMASARAVVASDVGAVASAVTHRETGLLVAPGDAAALAQAIDELARDAELRRELGDAARRLVESEFDLRACTANLQARLEAVYA